MKHRKKIISIIASVMLLACLAAVPVMAQPPVCSFGGTVTLDGNPVAAGTTITAKTDGTVVGSIGAYIEAGVSKYFMVIPQGGLAENAALNFYVVIGTNEYLGGTDTWNTGGTKTRNLVAASVVTVLPTVVTNAATAFTNNSATLNGNLAALGTATSVNVYFQWGTTTAYGNVTPTVAKTTPGAFSASIGGLSASTLYHFKAVAVGDGTSYGADMTFTTAAAPAYPVLLWWLTNR